MNRKQILWIAIVLTSMLLLAGCAQPEVVEEPTAQPVVETPVVEEEAYPIEEVVVEPETAYPVEEEAFEEEEPLEEQQPTQEEVVVDDEDALMEALISEKVGSCHALNFVLRQNKTREEWSVTIDRMIGYGAPINAEEKEIIIDFLVSREQ